MTFGGRKKECTRRGGSLVVTVQFIKSKKLRKTKREDDGQFLLRHENF